MVHFKTFSAKGTVLPDTIVCKKNLELALSTYPNNHQFPSYSTLSEAMASWLT